MDDRRRIVIRDPRLRHFRNCLRMVIYKAAKELAREIDERRRFLSYDEDGNMIYDHPDEIEQEIQDLIEKRSEINLALEASIISCGSCNSLDQDMEYIEKFKSWFCVKCANDRI